MSLTKKEEKWIEKAIESDYTELQVRKVINKSKIDETKKEEIINEFLKYKKAKEEILEEEKKERNKEEEKGFEKQVKIYLEDKEKLSWSERREVKKWLNNCEKYMKALKEGIRKFKEEVDYMNEKGWETYKIQRELDILKNEMIERIIDSKEVLEVENPKTREEATKENLKDLNIDELILLLEDVVNSLDQVVNGKITE